MATEAPFDEWKLSSFLGANTSAFAWRGECHMTKPSGNHGNHEVGRLVSDFMQGVVSNEAQVTMVTIL